MASPQCGTIFYPIVWPKDLLLQHHWFQIAKLRLIVTDRPPAQNGGAQQTRTSPAAEENLWATSSDKKYTCIARSQFHF